MLDVMLPVVLGESYFDKPLIPIPLLKTMRTANELSASRLLKLMEATEKRGDYRNKLSAVNVPVTILHGEEDLLITEMMAKEVQNSIRNSKLVVISGAGHTLNLEAIDVMANAINELL
jgi:3-oxoadipate enol-lactonase